MAKTIEEIENELNTECLNSFEAIGKKLEQLPLILRVLNTCLSYVFFAIYKIIDKLNNDLYPNLASDPAIMQEHLDLQGITLKQGVKATGFIKIKIISPGVVPKDTKFVYEAVEGVICEYVTDIATANLQIGEHKVAVTAVDFGTRCNLSAGTVLKLSEGSSEIDDEAIVDYLSGGVDKETIYEGMKRCIEKIHSSFFSGTANDYSVWAKQVSEVYKVFVYSKFPSPGQVTVHFTIRSQDDFIPKANVIKKVEDELKIYQPAGIDVIVDKPLTYTLNIDIKNLTVSSGYTLDDVKGRIKNDLKKYLWENANTKANSDLVVQKSVYNNVISEVQGETGHQLVIENERADGSIVVPEKTVVVLGSLKFDGVIFV